MSNVAKLKKEAADLEGKKQFDKALVVYARLLSEFERHPQEIDVALFNRVGDLQVKQGKTAEGLDTFEKAEMATDLMEHDLDKLNLLRQRGRESFAGRESELREFLT